MSHTFEHSERTIQVRFLLLLGARSTKLVRLLTLWGLALTAAFSWTSQAEEQSPAAAAATSHASAAAQPKPQPDANGYYVGGPVYVSDKNKIWTRSGPSEGYRITGARQIGERMTFVRYSENGRYAQLEVDGTTFWMPLETLQPEICGEPLSNQLRTQLAELQARYDNYDNEIMRELKTAQEELTRLTRENAELKSSIANKDETIAELDELYRDYAERLETKDLDMQMRWWMQGALIALCGAIAGVIFVFIPRPSRKQKRERY